MAKDGVGIARRSSSVSRPSAALTVSKPSSVNASKLRVSDRLEEDAQEMEERLIQLRIKMQEDKQRFEKELPAKFSGSRWRSAQEGIGSVSRYAKDVEDRMSKPQAKTAKKKEKDLELGESKPEKKKKKKTKMADDAKPLLMPSVASVEKWTTAHALEWLTTLGLDEFHSAFEYHQVTGASLLQMQRDEFAQIGMDRLSARNLVWNELERLRDAAKMAVQRGASEASEIIDPKIRDVALVPEVGSPAKDGGVHWSHVKPLRDDAKAGGQAEVPVNLADGDFDEDAGHASFMKALLDWRAGDGDGAAAKEEVADGMWFNPMMSGSDEQDEAKNNQSGGALLDGEYDEAKEQEAFRLAVLAWRQGSSSADANTNSRPATAEIERIEQGSATDQRKSCWQCYRVVRADTLVVDADTRKAFCGGVCQSTFKSEHARLYTRK